MWSRRAGDGVPAARPPAGHRPQPQHRSPQPRARLHSTLWEDIAYEQRKFFDWGGWLATRPMNDLPYWRVVMHRERDGDPDCDPRIRRMGREHAGAIAEMRSILQERGVVNNRDFEMATRTRTRSCRGRKDSSLALYYLWRTEEVMTHHRENFERSYALTETIVPSGLLRDIDRDESDRFLVRKDISFSGLSRLNRTSDAYSRGVPFSKGKEILTALLTDGDVIEVKVEGWRPVHYALAGDLEIIEELSAGRVPPAWASVETSTTEEVVFLAPLDQVSARGRSKRLFGFDYVGEVYKPVNQRKCGYYTIPVLWGDRLVARFDSKLDRGTETFVILGLWLEDEGLAKDETFAEALARGFARFVAFLGAGKLDASAIDEPLLPRKLKSARSP